MRPSSYRLSTNCRKRLPHSNRKILTRELLYDCRRGLLVPERQLSMPFTTNTFRQSRTVASKVAH